MVAYATEELFLVKRDGALATGTDEPDLETSSASTRFPPGTPKSRAANAPIEPALRPLDHNGGKALWSTGSRLKTRPDLAPWACRWGHSVALAWGNGTGSARVGPGSRPPPSSPRHGPSKGAAFSGPGTRTAGLGNKDRSSELCPQVQTGLSRPPWTCVSRKGGMLAPPSPPAKCRRLGLASGSSKSRVVPRSPGRVAAALGSTRAAGDPGVRLATCCKRPRAARFPTRPAGPGDPEKFAVAAARLGPGISIAARAPLPSASPWRLLEVGGGKQTQRKAKYYECSWGDFRGAGDRRA